MKLDKEKLKLIKDIFFDGKTYYELSIEYHTSISSIFRKKENILKKLRKLMKNV